MTHIAWLILGVMIGAGVLLFGYALCKAAGDADRARDILREIRRSDEAQKYRSTTTVMDPNDLPDAWGRIRIPKEDDNA